MHIYKIVPRAPFHFGERGIGQEETAEFPHSDTLFAAMISAWRIIYSQREFQRLMDAVTNAAENSPIIRLSSAFPYIGDVYFLPRPAVSLVGVDDDRKRGKKVDYISWRQASNLIESDLLPRVQAEDTMMGGRLWLHPQEKLKIRELFGQRELSQVRPWSSAVAETMARVTVDRISSASALYYQGVIHFAKQCGFYLLADLTDKSYRKPLEDALHFLGEQGLGGRRSVGLGQFVLEEAGEVTLGAVGGEEIYHWLLSLYHPTRVEITGQHVLDGARYTLITRRGWIYSPDNASQRRRAIRLLAEGSLLSHPVTGDVVDVRPKPAANSNGTGGQPGEGFPHPVWRSGLALTITTRRWRNA